MEEPLRRVFLLFFAFFQLFGAADASEWAQVVIESLGFAVDVPPDFAPSEEAVGGGFLFDGKEGARLAIGGQSLADTSFTTIMRRNREADEGEGWDITYDRLTSSWASYSGVLNDQIRYVRAIQLCGDKVALFVLDYSRDEKRAYDPIILRMVRSLKQLDC